MLERHFGKSVVLIVAPDRLFRTNLWIGCMSKRGFFNSIITDKWKSESYASVKVRSENKLSPSNTSRDWRLLRGDNIITSGCDIANGQELSWLPRWSSHCRCTSLKCRHTIFKHLLLFIDQLEVWDIKMSHIRQWDYRHANRYNQQSWKHTDLLHASGNRESQTIWGRE